MAYDAIVIGGGHNGLVAACYLGKAGKKVLVLERRHVAGGAAISEEFHPGYRNSVASYAFGLMRGEVVRDLELKRRGLQAIAYTGAVKLLSDGRQIQLTGDAARDQATFARISNSDYDNMNRLYAQLRRVGDVIRNQWLREPPDLAGGLDSIFSSLRMAGEMRNFTIDDRQFLVQMFTLSAWDLMSRWFESPTMRNIFTGHCASSNFMSLYAPGSALPFFINVLGELDGQRNKWGIAKGGMGGVTDAILDAAKEYGVEIRVNAPVARVLVRNGRAEGVALDSGEEIRARVVLSNADAKRTFLQFVGREHLDSKFASDIEHIRVGQASFRINLALAGVPEFADISGTDATLARGAAITVIPDAVSLEKSYQAARLGEVSTEPFIHVQIPSALDPDLAPKGHHVMGLLAKYYPYTLSGGRNWDAIKDQTADHIISVMARHIPNLPKLIVGRQVFTPLDLERVFALPEGDVFHARHDLDQIFSLRPHPKAARYRTPIKALYLCGSGVHPGGGVTGAPGHNAARRVLKDFARL